MPRPRFDPAPRPAVPDLAARRARIVELNDQLRSNFRGGRVQMTDGVYGLDPCLRGRALQVMSRYNKFDEDSEHNQGSFIFAGYSFEWRIEYGDKDGACVSPDPSGASKTERVLTLYVFQDVLNGV